MIDFEVPLNKYIRSSSFKQYPRILGMQLISHRDISDHGSQFLANFESVYRTW